MNDQKIQKAIEMSALSTSRFWPQFGHLIGGGELISMEDDPENSLKVLLDRSAGIDALRIGEDGRPQPLALRTQWIMPYEYPYRSFTIRKNTPGGGPTEFEKLGKAILHGYLRPHYTIHIYAKKPNAWGDLFCVGIVRTDDLYNYVIGYSPIIMESQGTEFYVVTWDELRSVGIEVKEEEFSEVEERSTFDLDHMYYLMNGHFDI